MNLKHNLSHQGKVIECIHKLVRTLTVAALFVVTLFNPCAVKADFSQALLDMSPLTQFTTFGNFYNNSLVTVNGNVGISSGGRLLQAAPSIINGNVYLGTGATITGPGVINGTIYNNQNLTAAQNAVTTVSAELKNLTANANTTVTTLNKVTSARTFTASTTYSVINMNSLTLGSGNITLNGNANQYFVLNIAAGMSLTGSSSIVGTGGLLASHIFINLTDTSGKDLKTIADFGNMINGTLFIPYDTATLHSLNGGIWAGAGEITLMSGATVNGFHAVPEPTTVLTGILLLLPLGASALRLMRKHRAANQAA